MDTHIIPARIPINVTLSTSLDDAPSLAVADTSHLRRPPDADPGPYLYAPHLALPPIAAAVAVSVVAVAR
jgi:hypothetical protein